MSGGLKARETLKNLLKSQLEDKRSKTLAINSCVALSLFGSPRSLNQYRRKCKEIKSQLTTLRTSMKSSLEESLREGTSSSSGERRLSSQEVEERRREAEREARETIRRAVDDLE